METQVIDYIVNKLIDLGAIEEQELEGCTIDQINKAMKSQRVSFLPAIYRELLLRLGERGFYEIMGSDCSCKYLNQLKPAYGENKNPEIGVPEDAFVFAVHQGYLYWFFRTVDEQENPPVFGFSDDYQNVKQLADSFSDFLYILIEEGV